VFAVPLGPEVGYGLALEAGWGTVCVSKAVFLLLFLGLSCVSFFFYLPAVDQEADAVGYQSADDGPADIGEARRDRFREDAEV
jgi:hypothetical protein